MYNIADMITYNIADIVILNKADMVTYYIAVIYSNVYNKHTCFLQPCRTSCSRINPCVACNITKNKDCSEEDKCGRIVFLDRVATGRSE